MEAHELTDFGAFVRITPDLKTVAFVMPAGGASDNFRIITASPDLIAGDATLDGVVDAADYTVWADNFLKPRRAWIQGDFTLDQITDAADYTVWADNFSPVLGVAAVPEPSTLFLGITGLIALLSAKRKL